MKEFGFKSLVLTLGRAIAKDQAKGPYEIVTHLVSVGIARQLRRSMRSPQATHNGHKLIIEERAYADDMQGLFSWDPSDKKDVEW